MCITLCVKNDTFYGNKSVAIYATKEKIVEHIYFIMKWVIIIELNLSEHEINFFFW